jgi:nitrite reductase (NADH) small subunit
MLERVNWIEVGRVEDVPARGARVVRTPLGEVAVFRTGTDEVFALVNRCPHANGPLSEGIVHDRSVTCPLHGRVISLVTGRMREPDVGCTPTLPVQVDEDGTIRLALVPETAEPLDA